MSIRAALAIGVVTFVSWPASATRYEIGPKNMSPVEGQRVGPSDVVFVVYSNPIPSIGTAEWTTPAGRQVVEPIGDWGRVLSFPVPSAEADDSLSFEVSSQNVMLTREFTFGADVEPAALGAATLVDYDEDGDTVNISWDAPAEASAWYVVRDGQFFESGLGGTPVEVGAIGSRPGACFRAFTLNTRGEASPSSEPVCVHRFGCACSATTGRSTAAAGPLLALLLMTFVRRRR